MSDDTTAMLTDQTKLIEALEPCPAPWCESRDIVMRQSLSGRFSAECATCCCLGPSRPTEAEATAAWNTRTLQSPVAAVSDGVRRTERLTEQLSDLKFGIEELGHFIGKMGGTFHEDWERTSEFLEFGAARIGDAIAALATPAPDQGEVERLREAVRSARAAIGDAMIVCLHVDPDKQARAKKHLQDWISATSGLAVEGSAALRPDTDPGKDATK